MQTLSNAERIAVARFELLIDARALAATRTLRGAGIESMLLKGRGTEEWLYSDGARGYTDVDLLVMPADHAAATEHLRNGPYRLAISDPDEVSPHASTLRSTRADGISVDLHRSFHGVGDAVALWRALWADREPLALGGGSVEAPGRLGRILIVALHAGAEGARKPLAIADLELAIRIEPMSQWLAARELAIACGAVGLFDAGLATTEGGRALMEHGGIRSTASARDLLWASGRPPLASAIERLIETRGARARLRLLRRELHPTREFMLEAGYATSARPAALARARARRLAFLVGRVPAAAASLLASHLGARKVAR